MPDNPTPEERCLRCGFSRERHQPNCPELPERGEERVPSRFADTVDGPVYEERVCPSCGKDRDYYRDHGMPVRHTCPHPFHNPASASTEPERFGGFREKPASASTEERGERWLRELADELERKAGTGENIQYGLRDIEELRAAADAVSELRAAEERADQLARQRLDRFGLTASQAIDEQARRAEAAEARLQATQDSHARGVWVTYDEMCILQHVGNNVIEEKEERVIDAIVERWNP